MNREEARYILRAYRYTGQDASDPQFKEALELARQDPELARWFAEEQAFDTQMAKKLRTVPVPADIKTRLLAARKIIQPVPWWRKTSGFAAAAAVFVVLMTLAFWLLPRGADQAGLADFRLTMAKTSLDMASHIDVMGLSAEDLRKWIADHQGIVDFELPSGLRAFPVAGCKIIDWHGHRVTLLCLKPDGKHVDLFVINASELPGISSDSTPQIAIVDNVTTAIWQRDGKVYLLAGAMPQAELERLL